MKCLTILISLLIISSSISHARQNLVFDANILTSSGDGAYSVYAADIDNDGDIDIAYALQGSDKIGWYENKGGSDPDFINHTVSSSADAATSVIVIDVNGDGFLDLVSSSDADDKIAWYENDGFLRFTERVVDIDADGARSVVGGDLDGDGDIDLAAITRAHSEVVWYQNDGNETFYKRVITRDATNGWNIQIGDVDDDGDLDLVSASYGSDCILFHENNGASTPTFSNQEVSCSVDGATSAFIVDIDSDGDNDIISGSQGADKVYWHENNGSESFTIHTVSTSADAPQSVFATDIDNDGDIDILSSDWGDGEVNFYSNNGSESFSQRKVSDISARPRSVFAADINGDGKKDVISAASSDEIIWYETTSFYVESTFPANGAQNVPLGTGIEFNFSDEVLASTVNTDNFGVVGNSSGAISGTLVGGGTKKVIFYPNEDFVPGESVLAYVNSSVKHVSGKTLSGHHTFVFTVSSGDQTIPSWSVDVIGTQSKPTSVAAANLGGSTRELIVTSRLDNTVAYYKKNGSSYDKFTISNTVHSATDVTTYDLDSDGDQDVIVGLIGNNGVQWFQNNGGSPLSFTEHKLNTSYMFETSVSAGSINNDGYWDIVGTSQNVIYWYKSSGGSSPTFTEYTVGSVNKVTSVYAIDMNRDSNVDIVAASERDNSIYVFFNNGGSDPTFTKQLISNSAAWVQDVKAVDVDGDGHNDIISASELDNKIAWYENDGNSSPSFTEHVVSTGAMGAQSVHFGDIDNDGNIDLASASRNDDKIAWYKSDGQTLPSFTEKTISTYSNGAKDVIVVEAGTDGKLDLVAVSENDNEISLMTQSSIIVDDRFSSQPGRNENGVSTSSNIQVTFDYAIDESTLDVSSFIITGDQTGRYEGNYSMLGTNTIVFDPIEDFEPGEVVTVVLTNDLETHNAPYILSDSFQFTVATSFSPNPQFASRTLTSSKKGTSSMVPFDLDKDGDLDIVSSTYFDNTIEWYENNGEVNPSYTIRTIDNDAQGAEMVDAGDLDGDGDVDIVVALRVDDTIVWYENDNASDPSFTKHIITTSVDSADAVTIVDVDNDGDMDIMAVSYTGTKSLVWLDNNGAANPTFHLRTVKENMDGNWGLHYADFDSDGFMDIVTAGQKDGKISWFKNSVFSYSNYFFHYEIDDPGWGAKSVYAADMDGDGDMDIVAGIHGGIYNDVETPSVIKWYENNGDKNTPVFTKHEITNNAGGVYNITAGDYDGDGDMDIISVFNIGQMIVVHENNGAANPSFSQRIIASNLPAAFAVNAADLDGDGDLDLLGTSASNLNGIAKWYENTASPIAEKFTRGSLKLDGHSGYVQTGERELDINPGFTMEGWVKPEELSTKVQRLFAKPSAYGFGYSSTKLRFTTYGKKDYDLPYAGLKAGKWHHLAAVFTDGFDVIFYVDGDSVGRVNGSLAGNENSNAFLLGHSGGSEYVHGHMDELRIWDKELTADEIRKSMFTNLIGNEPSLLAYWPLDENTGGVVFGKTSSDPDGRLIGNVTRSGESHRFGSFMYGEEGWRILTSPYDGASYAEILDGLWTQGFSGADHEGGSPNVFVYVEGDGNTNASLRGFKTISDIDDIPEPGQAIVVYVYEDDDPSIEGIQGGFPKLMSASLTQRTGSIDATLSLTKSGSEGNFDAVNDGWNLVGNPYGGTIDWDASKGWQKTGLDNTIYLWSSEAGSYLSWNGSTGTLGSGKVAPMQGFWVKANNDEVTPAFSVNDTVRSAGGYLLKTLSIPEIRITASGNGFKNSSVIMFSDKASIQKDSHDAYKLASFSREWLSVSTRVREEVAMDIQALPLEFEHPVELSLGIDGSDVNGEFKLEWNLKMLPDHWNVYLKDDRTGQTIDLRTTGQYKFELNGPVKKQGSVNPLAILSKPKVLDVEPEQRFKLIITNGETVNTEIDSELPITFGLNQNYPNPFNPSTVISYQLPENSKVDLRVFDILGREVAILVNKQMEAGHHQVTFNARQLASGMYLYRLVANGKVFTKKLTLIK